MMPISAVFEQGILEESMFSLLADAHERILAVKFDGPTKEDYVWGFRVGFVTFATKLNSDALYSALEEKTAGAIRGNISNASNIAQTLLLAAYSNAAYNDEKAKKYSILKRRYEKIRQLLSLHPEYYDYFSPLPFNSGNFMCVKVKCGDAERVRRCYLINTTQGLSHKRFDKNSLFIYSSQLNRNAVGKYLSGCKGMHPLNHE